MAKGDVARKVVRRLLLGHTRRADLANLPHLVRSFLFKMSRPENCTLHQIGLNGIQTNFYVVPTFSPSPSPSRSLGLLCIAAQAISPSVPHLESIPGGREKENIEGKEVGRRGRGKIIP